MPASIAADDHPPLENAGFVAFSRTLASQEIHPFLREAQRGAATGQ
jgi:hypothetical protein